MNITEEIKAQEKLYRMAVAQAKLNGTNSEKDIDELYFKLVEIRIRTKQRLAERKSQ